MWKPYYISFRGPYIGSKHLKAMHGNNKLQIQESNYIPGGREIEL